MKYMFASDIHGSGYYCRKMLEAFEASGAERLILLGDILYHGPRNDLPKEYAPKEVIRLLNERKDRIYAVRGNCDTEVDQMVLDFPILADYALFVLNGITFYATHGHIYHQDHLPPIQSGDVLIHGHTHLLKAEKIRVGEEGSQMEIGVLNPGSTSIPKGGNPATYGLLDDRTFTILTFDGQTVAQIVL